jgi:hypothetical protein
LRTLAIIAAQKNTSKADWGNSAGEEAARSLIFLARIL